MVTGLPLRPMAPGPRQSFTDRRSHRVIPRAGHNLPQEEPEAFADAVMEFDQGVGDSEQPHVPVSAVSFIVCRPSPEQRSSLYPQSTEMGHSSSENQKHPKSCL